MRVISRTPFKAIFYCAIIVALALGWGYFFELKRTINWESIVSFVGYVSFGTTILWKIWDRWLWRWPLLNKISKVPNFSGRWEGTYKRKGSESDGKKHGYVLEIRQTFSNIICSTYQDNGTSSAAVIAEICDLPDERIGIAFFWEGLPQIATEGARRLQEDEDRYRGLTELTCSMPSPRRKGATLDGDYFTDRETSGSVCVTWKGRKRLGRFQ